MKIYLDLIFFINFFIDLLLLITVSLILRRKTKPIRLFLGAFIGSVSLVILFIEMSSLVLFLFKIILAFLIVLITFGYRDIKYTLNNLLYFLTTSVVLGGFLYYLNIEIGYEQVGFTFVDTGLELNFYVLVIISPIILYIYMKELKNIKLFYQSRRHVEVYLKNGDVIKLNGYVDSGNTLKEPFGNKYVILAKNKKLENYSKFNNYILVPYKALNHEGIIKCIIPERVYIDGLGLKTNVVIGISEQKFKIEGIDCLLNILMEDL